MTGQTLAHYQLVEKLGEGGMGEVYKARDTRLNRFVAVKVLRAELTADEGRKLRLVQEARAASSLNHPNIVVVHDFAAEGATNFIVMEYVAGKTLDALIPREGMRLNDALRIGAQIADGLASAHAAGIVHRDLKPSNVIVGDDGRVKVLDFGLAKVTEEPVSGADEATQTRLHRTEEGTIVGTVNYMSPEQAEGRKVDARSDIFSFGSVLYEMVSGQRPFAGESRLATLSAILKEEPKALDSVPADIGTIVRRCLRKDPSRRFQHMADLKVALDEVRESSESAGPTAAQLARPRRRVPTAAWVAGGVGVLSALALAAWWWIPVAEPPAPSAAAAFRRTPLTSYPGAETQATFSPDGRQVAFAWDGEGRNNFDIYVKIVGGGEPLRLTTAPDEDRRPAWSPDGTSIAFTRGNAIYTISPLGGAERKLADATSSSLAWTPDGKAIAFADSTAVSASPVMLLSLDSRERRQLTHPPQGASDVFFAFSPDGKRLAFVRTLSRSNSGILHVMTLPDGQPRAIDVPQSTFMYDIAWTTDSRAILATVERGTVSLWRVDADTGKSAQIAGLDDGARWPAVAHPSGRLAYSRTFFDENIWVSNRGEAKPVVLSTLRDFNPRLSPDGTRLAFVSDRTGGWEIFVSDDSGGHVVQLTSFGNLVADGIRWSPDGREIAFALLQTGNRDIYTVPVEGGSPRRLTSEPSDEGRPSYSMDGQSLYFRSNRSGREEIWKMPRQGGAPVQITRDGGFESIESVDGRTLYFVRARAVGGLWSMAVAGGEAQPVAGLEAASGGRWDVTTDGVCFLGAGTAASTSADSQSSAGDRVSQPIRCWNAKTGKSTEMAIVNKPVVATPPVLSVSRDGRRFYWHQTDHRDADLVLVEGFK
jgi:Tol biopolymer transport system component/tRNA A-37 threonylcarbamoyl transferase component Bud32